MATQFIFQFLINMQPLYLEAFTLIVLSLLSLTFTAHQASFSELINFCPLRIDGLLMIGVILETKFGNNFLPTRLISGLQLIHCRFQGRREFISFLS